MRAKRVVDDGERDVERIDARARGESDD